MRYHGNYCGPNWSAGRRQASVANSHVPAIDEFDSSCKQHDRAYAIGSDLKKADYLFYKQNWRKGVKRSLAALAVGVQGYFRSRKKTKMAAVKRGRSRGRSSTPVARRRYYSPDPLPNTPRLTPGRVNVRVGGRSRSASRGRSRSSTRSTVASSTVRDLVALAASGAKKNAQITAKTGSKLYAAKSVKKNKQRKFDMLGATITTEESGSKATSEVLFLGHASMPRRYAWRCMFQAILKKLYAKAGILPKMISETLQLVTATDSLVLVYKNSANAVSTSAVLAFSTVGTSIYAQAEYLANTYSTAWQAQVIVQEIQFKPAAGSILKFERLNLINARLAWRSASVMAFQNQSVSDSGGASTDVVNVVPLRGRIYSGRGNGTLIITDDQTNPPWVSNDTGLINPNNVLNGTNDPPAAHIFTEVKKYSEIKFEPGELKKSHLYDKFTINLNNFARLYNDAPSAVGNYGLYKLGKFQFLSLEKMIDSVAEFDQVKIAYEISNVMSCYLIGGYDTMTMPSTVDVL